MNTASIAEALATELGGTVYGGDIVIVISPATSVITCTATGRVMLNVEDRNIQLGGVADGAEHLASMYRAATSEVCS